MSTEQRENLEAVLRHDAALGLISPVFADLSGLPPLSSMDRAEQ